MHNKREVRLILFFLYLQWGHLSQVSLALYKGWCQANLNSLSKHKPCLMGKVWFHKQIHASLMLCRQTPIMINMWHLGPVHSVMHLYHSENCLAACLLQFREIRIFRDSLQLSHALLTSGSLIFHNFFLIFLARGGVEALSWALCKSLSDVEGRGAGSRLPGLASHQLGWPPSLTLAQPNACTHSLAFSPEKRVLASAGALPKKEGPTEAPACPPMAPVRRWLWGAPRRVLGSIIVHGSSRQCPSVLLPHRSH